MDGQLMDIGTIAGLNIAKALDLPEEKAAVIRDAIRDEINAMSSHFALAFADIQTQHEIAEKQLKTGYDNAISAHNYVRDNWMHVFAVAVAIFGFGVVTGRLA